MNDQAKVNVSEAVRDNDLMLAAVQRAVRQAVLTHARLGNPVCEWRDGKVVWISPEQILAEFGAVDQPAS